MKNKKMKMTEKGKGQYIRWCDIYETHHSNNWRKYIAFDYMYLTGLIPPQRKCWVTAIQRALI